MRSTTEPCVAIIGTRGYPSYYGGFETAIRKLAPYLAERKWKVTVYGRRGQVNLSDPTRDKRVKSLTTFGIDSTAASTLSFGFTATLHAFFHKPDVALVMNVANGFWLPLLKLRGIPIVMNVDGIEWEREKWGKTAKRFFIWGAKLSARFANHLIFDANAIANYWKEKFGRTGTFIPYGGEVLGETELEPGLVPYSYVLMVARFVPENSIVEFLDAAAELAREHDVVIVGSAPEGDPIMRRIRELQSSSSRVHWLGHIKDDRRLYSLWQHSGVYFHGHSVGGTNPALVQAMACGANVLARDTIYNREVLGDCGEFTAPISSEIAQKVRTMLLDLERSERNRNRARNRALSDYNWHGVNAAYEKALMQYLPTTK